MLPVGRSDILRLPHAHIGDQSRSSSSTDHRQIFTTGHKPGTGFSCFDRFAREEAFGLFFLSRGTLQLAFCREPPSPTSSAAVFGSQQRFQLLSVISSRFFYADITVPLQPLAPS